MKKAVIYARVSSEEQAKHGFSIDNQKRQCIEFAERNGYYVDKIFIDEIKKHNQKLKVFYGVRGKPIVNDVTIEDAEMIKMNESAEVVSNGDGGLGTVLKNSSQELKKIYDAANIVICKGQGNYERLLESAKDNLYFLFMAKCEIVADPLNIDNMSIVCMKNRKELKW